MLHTKFYPTVRLSGIRNTATVGTGAGSGISKRICVLYADLGCLPLNERTGSVQQNNGVLKHQKHLLSF